ncbi:hypothetical protein B0O99DRAFT_319118 [Bisporella sp. PMI_857]|nr:hypothetical protein B0O99DRAFT_319118 [Bisporella sp. PMI_857]
MKSFSVFVASSLFTIALTSPVEVARQELSNAPVPFIGVQGIPGKISVDTATGILFTETTGNETVTTRDVEKRALTHIDVYLDINFGGRHEALQTTTQVCYGLYNGWNDAISSLKVYQPFGCYFYVDGGCSGSWLSVPGGNNVAAVGAYGDFNDRFSSYLCYD